MTRVIPKPDPPDTANAHDESANRGAERAWYHVLFSTYGTWLRGDARGFRDHDHRIHSSGDYHAPPPPEEHAGLRRWTLWHMHQAPVRLPDTIRAIVGKSLLETLRRHEVDLVVVAVSSDHVHVLGRFPIDSKEQLAGHAKRASSHAIRGHFPGQVWAKKCLFKKVRSEAQQRSTFAYIRNHARAGAWVWTFRELG